MVKPRTAKRPRTTPAADAEDAGASLALPLPPARPAGAAAGPEEPPELKEPEDERAALVQLFGDDATALGPQLEIPTRSTPAQLEALVNQLLENSEAVPFAFYVDAGADAGGEVEVSGALADTMESLGLSGESLLRVVYRPLAVFRVRPVTRCTDTLRGHTEAVLHVSFSPDGAQLASGGGDGTVRFWDVSTSTPIHVCRGHRDHVLCTAWSPTGARFASADKRGEIRLWDPQSGSARGQPLRGHKQWVTALVWEPLHRNAACERLASASRDRTVRLWNTRLGTCLVSISGHSDSVECVRWGGSGLVYTGSRDRAVKVWCVEGERKDVGKLVRTLNGHGHRVNALALNADYVLRTGAFDHTMTRLDDPEQARAAAQARYDAVVGSHGERLVSCSDDFTMIIWAPETSKQPLQRLTGHAQLVMHIAYSPDGRLLASASFDKKVKVWDGRTGRFMATLTGHVGAVYQLAWSSDSRMLVSASKDSTCKLWDVNSPQRPRHTLPGHLDEVYALDWAPDGQRVATGSKDRTLKVWRH